jgi:hypothetical protein
MQISVYNNGQQLGPFPLEAVHNMVRLKSLPNEAMVWYEGAADWIPLPTFLQQYPVPAAPAAAAAPASGRMSTQQMLSASQAPRGDGQLSDGARLLRATIAGGVAALIGGGVWAGIAIATGIQLGYVAWGIGLLSGFAVSKLGRGHGTIFQVMAVLCSLAGIALGKVAIVMATGFLAISLVDIVFVILAVASAWQMAGGNR